MTASELAGEFALQQEADDVLAVLQMLGAQVQSTSSPVEESFAQEFRKGMQAVQDRLRNRSISADALSFVLDCSYTRMGQVLQVLGVEYQPGTLIDPPLQYRVREQLLRQREQLLSRPVSVGVLEEEFHSSPETVLNAIIGDYCANYRGLNPVIDASTARMAVEYMQKRSENRFVLRDLKTGLARLNGAELISASELAGEFSLQQEADGVLAVLQMLGAQVQLSSSPVEETFAQEFRKGMQALRYRLRNRPISADALSFVLDCSFEHMARVLRMLGYRPGTMIDPDLQYQVREQLLRHREQLLSGPVSLSVLEAEFHSSPEIVLNTIMGGQFTRYRDRNPVIDAATAQIAVEYMQKRSENRFVLRDLKTGLARLKAMQADPIGAELNWLKVAETLGDSHRNSPSGASGVFGPPRKATAPGQDEDEPSPADPRLQSQERNDAGNGRAQSEHADSSTSGHGGLSNRERIGRGLELLASGLGDFTSRHLLTSPSGAADWTEVFTARDRERGRPSREYSLSDPRFQLRVITEERNAFGDKLSPVARGYASKLRETGNRWAHGESFTDDDADRALDTISRLLTAVSATEQAVQARRLRRPPR